MIGTLVNVAAVLAGSAVGVLVGARLPERFTRIVFTGIGLFTLVIGFSMALKTQHSLIMVFSVVLGAIAGELIDIDRHLMRFGDWLKHKLKRKPEAQAGDASKSSSPDLVPRTPALEPQPRFSEGMVTAFLLFCMGSMTVLGALEEGMGKAPNLLLAKSVLDGFASVALAAGFGIGVAFSVVPLLVYQGGLTLVAMLVGRSLPVPVVTEVSAAGGVLLVGLGINTLEIRKLKVLNLLPALAFAGVLAAVFLRAS